MRRRIGTADRRFRQYSEICQGTLEKRPSLPAVWLKRQGAFNGRECVFRNLGLRIPGLAEVHSDGEHWLTTRTATGGSQIIGVSYRLPGLGGSVALFHCPDCNQRGLKLYDCGGARLGCRTCSGLWYNVQRHSGPGRKAFLAQKIRIRLGGNPVLKEPFPNRPPHMKRAVYRHYKAMGEFYEADLSQRMRYRQPDYAALSPR